MFKILRMVSLVFGMKYHTHLHQQTDVSWRYTLGLQRPCQPQSFDRHSEPHIALWNGPSIMRIIAQAFASIAAMCLVGTVARVTQSDSEHDPFSFDQLGILGRDELSQQRRGDGLFLPPQDLPGKQDHRYEPVRECRFRDRRIHRHKTNHYPER